MTSTKYNTFIRTIEDKSQYGAYVIQFNIDKRQAVIKPTELLGEKFVGFRYHHQEKYYYKRFKTLTSMKSMYKTLLDTFGEYFTENADTEKVVATKSSKKTSSNKAKTQPKTKTSSQKKSEPKAKAQPKVEPKVEPKAQTPIIEDDRIDKLIKAFAVMSAKLDSFDDKFEQIDIRFNSIEDLA